MIFFIRGNIRVNICTDDKIYFYLINNEEFKPKLENVMFNYMGCNNIIFGSDVSFAITYNVNKEKMTLFQRKYEHSYKGAIMKENLTNSFGLSIESMNKILLAKNNKGYCNTITVIDNRDYLELKDQEIELRFNKSFEMTAKTKKRSMILSMTACDNEKSLAVIYGEKLK